MKTNLSLEKEKEALESLSMNPDFKSRGIPKFGGIRNVQKRYKTDERSSYGVRQGDLIWRSIWLVTGSWMQVRY